MKNIYIDLNCDVGEGVANEEQLFPYISSCNIACGGHYGTIETIRSTVKKANKYKVKIGAHPSYPDLVNFGRQSLFLAKEDFISSVQLQMQTIATVLEQEKVKLHHIKPHGALYNDLVKNKVLANEFLEAIAEYKKEVFLYVPHGSEIEKLAKQKSFQIKLEAFADRNYEKDLSLVSRKKNNAVLQSPKAVLEHLVLMCKENLVKTKKGTLVSIKADTFCVHGDTNSALEILKYLSQELSNSNIYLS